MDSSEQFLLTALASIGDGVITTDAQGQVVFLNAVAQSLTGWNLAEAVGEPLDVVFRIVNETTRQAVENPVARALREGGIVGLANHTILIAKDGAERPVDDSAAPIRNKVDEIVGCVLVFRDVTERRNAERADALLAAIVADSDDAIISKTLDGVILSWNAGAERLYGYSAAEAIGQTIDFIVPNECRDEEREILEELRSGQRIDHYETVRCARGGKRIHVSLTISPLRDAYGNIVGASNVSRDITERKRAERQRLERDKQLRLMADSAPVLIWVSDAQNRGVFFNERWLSFTGRTLDQELGNGWLEGIHPADVHRAAATCLDAFHARESFQMEFRLRRADGSYRWILDHGVPRFAQGGAFAGYIGSCIDVTEQHESERAAQESQQKLQAVLEVLPLPLFIADANGRLEKANPAADEMWGGVRLSEHSGSYGEDYKAWWPATGEPVRSEEWGMSRALSAGEKVSAEEMEILDSDGNRRTILNYARPVRDAEGNITGGVAVNVDVTRLKQAEERLREADRRKDDFLAMLAHELRSPLAALCTGLEVLKGLDADPSRRSEIRAMMERQSRHLVTMVDDLLEISRFTSGKMQLREDHVSLADTVHSAIETARPAIDQAGHRLEVQMPEEQLVVIGDPHRLSQIFSNLLNNAARYTPGGGDITVTLQQEQGHAVLAVRDSGIGIAPGMHERIFDMFAQVEHPLDREAPGLGLGLSLAKALTERHGGAIEVHSEGHGKGSEFRVRLPLPANAATAAAQPTEVQTHRPGSAKRRVLIADDNPDAVEMLRLLLEGFGSEVRTAADGAQAVEVADDFRPEVVLMDLGMPRVNGYEAAERIRAEDWGKKLTLVALTGWGQEKDRQRIMQAGFDHHLVKPARSEQLRALLEAPRRFRR